jgi:hypothetical protein
LKSLKTLLKLSLNNYENNKYEKLNQSFVGFNQ